MNAIERSSEAWVRMVMREHMPFDEKKYPVEFNRAMLFAKAAFSTYVDYWRAGKRVLALLKEWDWAWREFVTCMVENKPLIKEEAENRPWTLLLDYAWDTLCVPFVAENLHNREMIEKSPILRRLLADGNRAQEPEKGEPGGGTNPPGWESVGDTGVPPGSGEAGRDAVPDGQPVPVDPAH